MTNLIIKPDLFNYAYLYTYKTCNYAKLYIKLYLDIYYVQLCATLKIKSKKVQNLLIHAFINNNSLQIF